MLERPIAIGIHEAAPGTRAAAANEGELAELHAAVSPLVDGEWYKAKYPHDGESAYLHFMTVGVAADANPNPYFDTRWYRETYPHYREHTDNPLVHYVLRGWLEGAQPSPRFDAVRYLTDYPDVRAEQFEPLTHFLSHGRFERRRVYALDGAKPGAPTQPAIVPPATAKPTLTAPAAAVSRPDATRAASGGNLGPGRIVRATSRVSSCTAGRSVPGGGGGGVASSSRADMTPAKGPLRHPTATGRGRRPARSLLWRR